jgi:hypothetical protein
VHCSFSPRATAIHPSKKDRLARPSTARPSAKFPAEGDETGATVQHVRGSSTCCFGLYRNHYGSASKFMQAQTGNASNSHIV